MTKITKASFLTFLLSWTVGFTAILLLSLEFHADPVRPSSLPFCYNMLSASDFEYTPLCIGLAYFFGDWQYLPWIAYGVVLAMCIWPLLYPVQAPYTFAAYQGGVVAMAMGLSVHQASAMAVPLFFILYGAHLIRCSIYTGYHPKTAWSARWDGAGIGLLAGVLLVIMSAGRGSQTAAWALWFFLGGLPAVALLVYGFLSLLLLAGTQRLDKRLHTRLHPQPPGDNAVEVE